MKLTTVMCFALAAIAATTIPVIDAAQELPAAPIQIHVDPETGEIVDDPVEGWPVEEPPQLTPQPRRARIAEEPVIEPGPTEAGGINIAAPPWTKSQIVITRGLDGAIQHDCQKEAR